MCAGCAHRPLAKQAIQLPAAPSIMRPVPDPELPIGENAKGALGDTQAALNQANDQLAKSRAWYEAMRKRYRAAPLP